MHTHHARLVFSKSKEALTEFVRNTQTTSEVTMYEYTTVAIADVRQLIATAYLKPTGFLTRTIIITAFAIAPEAQHALLKILEEPPSTTKFVLWLCPDTTLLPTLRSRLAEETIDVRGTAMIDESVSVQFVEFLTSTKAARFERIATHIKNKNLAELAELASSLGGYLTTTVSLPTPTRSQILWCLSQLELRGSSKKMLWEEISLLLPVEAKR